jgi:N-acetylglutamate synthase-like GNAT family acetyltransferase
MLEVDQIEKVVRTHLRAFPGFFLSFLGPSFLREFYYGFVADKRAVGLVAKDKEGNILGVVVGSLDPKHFFSRLLVRRWWAFCFSSLKAVLHNPLIALRISRAIFYRGLPTPDMDRALLSSLAVDPEWQNKGVGGALVRHWLAEVRKQGGKGCYLTTDANENQGTKDFYKKAGWVIESTYHTPEGRRMCRYIYDF